MQHALNTFEDYCSEWKLTVNIEKIKFMIFGQRKINTNLKFTFNKQEIEIVKEYKYLGILPGQSGSFLTTKKFIAEQASIPMFSLLRKVKTLQLPFDIQIDLFNKIVKPILGYGCEIWSFGNFDSIEHVQLTYFKYVFNLKKSTPSAMIYGELGVMPLAVDIKSRVLTFWSKIIGTHEIKTLSHEVYKIIYVRHENNEIKSQWITNLKTLICSLGFAGIWYSQSFFNVSWFVKASTDKIRDIFIKIGLQQLTLHHQVTFIDFSRQNLNKASTYLYFLPISVNDF